MDLPHCAARSGEPATVVVIGGGTAGYSAARVASGMGATVTVLDVDINTTTRHVTVQVAEAGRR